MHSDLDVSHLTLDSSMLGVYPELVQPWVERRHFQRMSCAALRWWTSWWEVSVSFMIVGTCFNSCPWYGGVSRGWAGFWAVTAAVLPGSPVPAGDAGPAVQGGPVTPVCSKSKASFLYCCHCLCLVWASMPRGLISGCLHLLWRSAGKFGVGNKARWKGTPLPLPSPGGRRGFCKGRGGGWWGAPCPPS